jgi:hypothetical protein
MRRTLLGASAFLCLVGTPSWGQAAPPPQPEGGSFAALLLLVVPLFAIVLLLFVFSRSRKVYGAVDRSLQIGEESLQLGRQQLAMQAETNRLLKQLLDSQVQGN